MSYVVLAVSFAAEGTSWLKAQRQVTGDLAGIPVVTAVPTLLTMQLGPGAVLVAAKVDFDDEVSGAEIEEASDEAERRLRARYAGIRYVFLDPTRGKAGRDHRDGGVDI